MLKTIPFERSFASNPKSEFLNNELNGGIKPENITFSSGNKYWFNCNKCSHLFYRKIAEINMGGWCPYCCNPPKQLCSKECSLCFNKSFASSPKSICWNYKKNGNIIPRNVFLSSNKKFYFNCDKCSHIFNIALGDVSTGNYWCGYCANKKLCETEDCNECFFKSFASNPKSICWNYELNDNIKPRDVFMNSSTKKYWFNCDKCTHSFNSTLAHINEGTWCPYCSNPPRILCEKNCCECFNKSFASHPKSIYWVYELNNQIKPRDVFKSTAKMFWFNCEKCNHNFNIRLYSIIDNVWCSYCGGNKLCEIEKCEFCFFKSFKSHKQITFWDYNKNKIDPRMITKGTQVKYWFICEKNHSFDISLSNLSHNNWCRYCVNKTEAILFEYLQTIYSTTITEFRPDWIGKKRYDFCIPEHNIIIELDGIQHFKQVSNWKSPEQNQETDKYKEKHANINGFSIIRILQEDVINNTYDWKTTIHQNITEIINSKTIMNIYMCHNNEYMCHQEDQTQKGDV
jgi:very-short-patch-repair endonuclease